MCNYKIINKNQKIKKIFYIQNNNKSICWKRKNYIQDKCFLYISKKLKTIMKCIIKYKQDKEDFEQFIK